MHYFQFAGQLSVIYAIRSLLSQTIYLGILEENFHDSISVYGDSFHTDFFNASNVNTSSGCILFLCSHAVALFRYVNGRGSVTYPSLTHIA